MHTTLIMMSTYNGETYLKEQIESLVAQNNQKISVLVRDDGSTDNTLSVLECYSKQIDMVYYAGENKGSTYSFFDLIEKAELTYDYYAFCDQDDVWFEDKIDIAVTSLEKLQTTKPALYYCGQKVTDAQLNIVFDHTLDTSRTKEATFIFNQMAGCTAVFNRQLMKQMKKYIPQNISDHDAWCYKLCAALGGEIIVDQSSHMLYRQHGNNVIGLSNGIGDLLKRSGKYINEYMVATYATEIIKGYEADVPEQWRLYLQTIIDSNHSFTKKMQLLTNHKIIFHSKALRILFIIKTLMGKM